MALPAHIRPLPLDVELASNAANPESHTHGQVRGQPNHLPSNQDGADVANNREEPGLNAPPNVPPNFPPNFPPIDGLTAPPNFPPIDGLTAQPSEIIHVDPNMTPDGRRIPRTMYEQFLVKSFEENMVLTKPNITTVAFILVSTVFSILIAIAVSTETPNLVIIIYGYWLDILVELILLLLYVRTSDMLLIRYSNWAIVPWLMKLIMIASVSADLYRGTNVSIYICFLVILPCFFNTSPNFCYHKITMFGFCFSLIMSIAEILVVIKLFSGAGFPYRAIFDYLFYFFIVAVFFTGLVFLVSTCGIICHFCRVNRDFPLKLKISQWFYGIDTMFEILICFYMANFVDRFDQYNKYVNQKAQDSLFDTSLIDSSFKATNMYRESLFKLMIASSVYVFARMLLCFRLTYGVAPIMVNRNRNIGRGADHQPKMQKPSNTSAVLNLFRINTNYFSAQAGGGSNETGDKKADGEDTCSICYSKPPNCIILDCKHGGICDTCSFDMMKKSINCPFCRQPITKVCVVERIEESQYRVINEIKP